MRVIAVLMLVLVCVAFTCGCTAQTTSQKTTPLATQATQVTSHVSEGPTAKVSVIASSFSPAILNVEPGTTVTWTNEDRMSRRVEHLPTGATEKELFNSGSLSPGESFSYTFMIPGRYKYGDPQHGGGSGTYLVIVG
jgi:plastocyanin